MGFQIFFFSANYFNSFVFFSIKVNSFILITEIVLLNFMFVSNVREDSILVVWFPHCPSSRLHRFKPRASFFFFAQATPPLSQAPPPHPSLASPHSICMTVFLCFFFFLFFHVNLHIPDVVIL